MKKIIMSLFLLVLASTSCMRGGIYDNKSKDNLLSFITLFNAYDAVITSSVTGPTNDPTITFTITFGEPVTGFDISDIIIGGTGSATVTSITPVGADGTTYTITITPTADGQITIGVADGAALKPDSEPTGYIPPSTVIYDSAVNPITASIQSNNTNPDYARVGCRVTVSFTAGEELLMPAATINGHTATISGGPVNWAASYVMTNTDPEVQVTFEISGIQDLAGNTAANETTVDDGSSVTFDMTAPSVTMQLITSTNAIPTYARTGDTIIINFQTNETIQTPTVTVSGSASTVTGPTTDWNTTRVMLDSDAEGQISYAISNLRDLAGNAAADITGTPGIVFDRTAPGFSGISPASNSVTSDYNVAYRLSEACASGSITWTETGGNDDPAGAPAVHTYALSGTELTTGVHNLTLGTITLNSGTIYSLQFSGADMAGNSGAAASTGVTYNDATLPTLSTTAAVSITDTSATSGGNITSAGGTAVTARGVCWNTSGSPTISDNLTSDGSGTGIFTSNITGLTSNTLYYVRAYATNASGTAYGNQIMFTTLAEVSTAAPSSVTDTTATSGGTITDGGGAAITERGTCWNTAGNPTIADSRTSDGNTTGTYASSIAGLTPNTMYYVRAYSTNAGGTSYGAEVTFTTNYPPLAGLSYASPQNLVVGIGINIMPTLDPTTYAYPLAFSVMPPLPTGMTLNPSTGEITGVPAAEQVATVYTVTAGNSGGSQSFDINITVNPQLVTLTTTLPVYSTLTQADTGGTITDTGGGAITQRGVCWNLTGSPTTGDSCTTDGPGGTGAFTSTMTTLLAGTTYHVRAYAINGAGTAYGDEVTYLHGTVPPQLTTVSISSSNGNPLYAIPGSIVTLTIVSDIAIQAPSVSIAGHDELDGVSVTGFGTNWQATYTMAGGDTDGVIPFEISNIQSLLGTPAPNVTATTDSTSITFDRTVPEVSIGTPSQTLINGSGSVDFVVNYSGADTVNLTILNLSLSTTGGANCGNFNVTNGASMAPTVTLSNCTGTGTVRLSIDPGTSSDTAGNTDLGAGPSVFFTVDATAPNITPGTFLSSNPINSTYARDGHTITVQFTTDEAVALPTVFIGTYPATITDPTGGGTGMTWEATYAVASGSNEVVGFNINVADLAGNLDSDTAPGGVTIDNTAPTIDHVEKWPADNVYSLGETITIQVQFNETIRLASGSMDVTLNTAPTNVVMNFNASWGPTNFIGMGYTVQPGYDSSNLQAVSIATSGGGQIVDEAGNIMTDFGIPTNLPAGIVLDGTAPTVAITGPGASTGTSPIPITITFSEDVTGFNAGSITVTNGSVSNLMGSGANYTAEIMPAAYGTVTVDIAAGVAQDAASNLNTAAPQYSITYVDTIAPTVAITGPGATTGASPIPITITFSEDVTGFNAASITVTNGSVSNLMGFGANYTADIYPAAYGTVTVDINAGVAQDAASNLNTAAPQYSITYVDTVAPTVAITGPGASTGTSPIPITITFSEDVTGFNAGSITVTNGSVSNLMGSGANYTAEIYPAAYGMVTVDINAGAVTDTAGNPNTAAPQYSITYVDTVAPTVAITGPGASTGTSPIPITITFSEDVTGFNAGSITVTNGSAGTLAGSGAVYTTNITPTGYGTVSVDVAANAAQDAALNWNTAAPTFSITYIDIVPPTVAITSAAPDPTGTAPIPVTITFSEPVTGFINTDITVTNGTAGTLAGSGAVYTTNITPTGYGTVSVDVAANAAQDAALNWNTAAPTFSITYIDIVPPTVAITSAAPDPTGTAPIPVTITFSEPVTGFINTDITVTNGTAGTLAGSGAVYTTNITPTGYGTVSVDVAANAAQDAALNWNTAAPTFSITYIDIVPPTVAITSAAPDPTGTAPIPVTITFSEPVTGFINTDITVTNGTAGTLAGSGAVYTTNITPTGYGTVSVDVAANAAQDAALNWNTAAPTFSITYIDIVPPTVAITSAAPDPTGTAPIPVTITFSEPVTGFINTDITVTNGTAGTLAGSGAVYTTNITPTGYGTVSVDVAANAAQDAALNWNTAAPTFSITYIDIVPPTVAITSAAPDPTGTAPIPVTITFSEDVTGFNAGSITVTNGSVSNLMGFGANYTADIYPAAYGTVTVDINAGVAQDAASNLNTAAPQYSITYVDTVAPTVAITGPGASTGTSPIPITITFSEDVTGFNAGSITVTNGSVSNLMGFGANYTAEIFPAAYGTVTVDINAGVAQDAASNLNTAAPQYSITYVDTVAPTVAITGPGASTGTSPIPITITFSEDVTGFNAGSITVTNGSVSNLMGFGANYTAEIYPAAYGTVTVDINAGAVTDTAGNPNIAAPQYTITYVDTVAPTVAITGPGASTGTSPIPITITFSEAVTGFNAGSITVTNGSVSNLMGFGANYTADIYPAAYGTVTVDINAGVAQDAASNLNTAAPQYTITYVDTVAPTVAITGPGASTGTSPIPITITFSEDVTGFNAGSITVTNGSVSNLMGFGANYTADIYPAAYGTVTVDINAGVAQDAASNLNIAAPQYSITYVDTVAPTVAITGPGASTGTSPIPITITFSEDVTGFNAGSITVMNGSVSNLMGFGANYTADIYPAAYGMVTVDINAGAVTDTAGNPNIAAPQYSINYVDTVAPTVAITGPGASTGTSPIPITITFSEDVTGFNAGSITVTNGSVSNLMGFGANYTAEIYPAAYGTVTVDINAGAVTDTAGNLNIAAPQYSITYVDTEQPTALSATPTFLTGFNRGQVVTVTITFSEPMNAIPAPTPTLTLNGTTYNISGSMNAEPSNNTWTGSFTLNNEDIEENSYYNISGFQDMNGNEMVPSTGITVHTDTAGPRITTITSGLSDGYFRAGQTITFTLTLSESAYFVNDVLRVHLDSGASVDINPTGSYVNTLNATYTVGAGDVSNDLNVASMELIGTATLQDPYSNNAVMAPPSGTNLADNKNFVVDGIAPTVAITGPGASTGTSPIPITITFSEDVTGFNAADITSNGTVSNLMGSGANYTAEIYPSAYGMVTVDINAGAVTDTAGNPNIAAPQYSITYVDTVAPTVAITGPGASTGTSPIPITITFSEDVTGFNAGSITVMNGSVSNLMGFGANYTAEIYPSAYGMVTVDINAGAVTDTAGNPNIAAPQYTITYVDTVAPTVAITGPGASTGTSPIPITITFSEAVTGFNAGSITVTNGSVSNLMGFGANYTADIFPAAYGTVTVDINAGVAQDAASNLNTAAPQYSITYVDTVAPTVAITGPGASTGTSPIPITITFSEDVTGFNAASITVTNGSVSNLMGFGANYTADIYPAAYGTVTVDINAGVAQDAASNLNTAAPQYSITYVDTVAPTVAITGPGASTGTSPIPITITFSEDVTGFNAGSITVTNGSVSNLMGSGANYTAEIYPAAYGTVTVDINAGAVTDTAGNPNIAAPQYSIEYVSPDINVRRGIVNYPATGSTYDFGRVQVGQSKSVTFTVENAGTGTLSLVSVGVSDTTNFSVTVPGPEFAELDAGTSTTITVTFAPQTTGTFGTSPEVFLDISSTDLDESSYTIGLTGEGVAAPVPDIDVRSGAVEYLSGDTYTFDTVMNTDVSRATFTIVNSGIGGLEISGISLADGTRYTVTGPGAMSIPGGGATTFTVEYRPLSSSPENDVLTITSNDPDTGYENNYIINLTGHGNGSPLPTLDITIDGLGYPTGSLYDFGFAGAGGSNGPVTFTITNNGYIDLDIYDLLVDAEDNTVFVVSGPVTTLIPPLGMETFTVTFAAPGDPGPYSTVLTINSNTEPYTLNLNGGSVSSPVPDINIEADSQYYQSDTWFDFGDELIGGSGVTVTFTVENFGTGADLNPNFPILSGVHDGDYTLDTTSYGGPVAYGNGTCTFDVTFTPGGEGLRSAVIEIPNDDPDENPYVIHLIGAGVMPLRVVHGGGNGSTSVYNPSDNTFSDDFLSMSNGVSSGAHSFRIPSGTYANQYMVIHGNYGSGMGASLYDPSGPSITNYSAGTGAVISYGAHSFMMEGGAYPNDFIVINGGGSPGMRRFDPDMPGSFNSFGYTFSPGIGSGSFIFKNLDNNLVIVHGNNNYTYQVFNQSAGTLSPTYMIDGTASIGDGGHCVKLTSGAYAGWMLIIEGGSARTWLFEPTSTPTITSGPNIPSANTPKTGSFSIPIKSGTYAGQVLIVHGGDEYTTSIYSPDSGIGTIADGPSFTNGYHIGEGAFAFPITGGTYKGMYMIVHGAYQSETTIFDPFTMSFIYDGSDSLPGGYTAGPGAHCFPAR